MVYFFLKFLIVKMSLTGKEGGLLSAIELGLTLRLLEAQPQVPASHITSEGSTWSRHALLALLTGRSKS